MAKGCTGKIKMIIGMIAASTIASVISKENAVKGMDADGTNIEILGSGFDFPSGIAIQSDGKILVADLLNNAIKRMDPDGTNIEVLGSGFSSPYGIAIQPDGKILVADFGNGAVKRMDSDGTNIEILGSGFISLPADITMQPDGKILVADLGSNAVIRMDIDGSNIEILTNQLVSPFAIAIQSDGKILMLAANGNRLYSINEDRSVDETGISFGSANGLLIKPNGDILIGINDTLTEVSFESLSNRVAVVVDFTLGLDDFESSELIIYPNPSTGIYNVKTNENISITVYDVLGKPLYKQEFIQGNSILNLTNKPSGIYILNIANSNGASRSYKLIKE